MLVGRGALIKAIGFGGNIVLARLLVPRDFGLVAFGTTIMFMTNFIGDGGMGAALVRRDRRPTRVELGAVNGLELSVAVLVAALTALSALPLGAGALVTTVMVLALPITALRTPTEIMFQRQLHLWAVGSGRHRRGGQLLLLGAFRGSCWARASGAGHGHVVRAVCGTVVLMVFSSVGIVRPRINVKVLRPLWRFGVNVQGARLRRSARPVGGRRDRGGDRGVAGLGIWSLAGRLMSIPALLLDTLWNVSDPAMSRLRDAGEDRRLDRGPFGASDDDRHRSAAGAGDRISARRLVPALFGAQWHGVVDVITILPLGMLVMGPVSVSTSGFLDAVGGDAGAVLKALVASATAT